MMIRFHRTCDAPVDIAGERMQHFLAGETADVLAGVGERLISAGLAQGVPRPAPAAPVAWQPGAPRTVEARGVVWLPMAQLAWRWDEAGPEHQPKMLAEHDRIVDDLAGERTRRRGATGAQRLAGIRTIAGHIRLHDVVNPLLVHRASPDKYLVLIGNQRLAALRALRYEQAPCLVTDRWDTTDALRGEEPYRVVLYDVPGTTGLQTRDAADWAEIEKERYERVWQDERYRASAPGLALWQHIESDVRGWLAGPDGAALAWPEKGKVLDIGCGSGRLYAMLCAEGYDAWGVDITDAGLDPEVARRWPNRCIVAPLWAAHLPDIYDAGICCDVMEHLPPEMVEPALAQLYAACRSIWFLIAGAPDTSGPRILGEALHRSVRSAEWWRAAMRRACPGATIEDFSVPGGRQAHTIRLTRGGRGE